MPVSRGTLAARSSSTASASSSRPCSASQRGDYGNPNRSNQANAAPTDPISVTQRQPSRKLAYTWNVFSPGEQDSSFPESYLTLELAPRDGGTLLTLTHLPVLEQFVTLNAMGWHTFLDMVEAASLGAAVGPREAYMKRNAERYGVDLSRLPK